ncbi:hypothetical protein C8T65DRAFT_672565, partial [Cerioporus squamosus]
MWSWSARTGASRRWTRSRFCLCRRSWTWKPGDSTKPRPTSSDRPSAHCATQTTIVAGVPGGGDRGGDVRRPLDGQGGTHFHKMRV